MSFAQHSVRLGLLVTVAAGLLAWISARTEVVFADGLRYIRQARVIDEGQLVRGLIGSVDHPAYPLSIAMAHRALGGEEPESWQTAAQAASVLAGILLIIPLYLVGVELFGGRSAWIGCLLLLLTPLYPRIFSDALSEGTFLLFWLWGLWSALRFLKEGRFAWLPLMIGFDALAYLTRPEALLLPVVMVGTLVLIPILPSTRLNRPRWAAATAFLVLGPVLLAGPFMAIKGGLGTKPAIARLIGTAPKSAADAVERSRPLDPDQTVLQTYAQAAKAAVEALRDAVTLPLIPLAVAGLWFTWRAEPRARIGLFLILLYGLGFAGLVRLHATGGYCTPRHALLLSIPLVLAAGAGLDGLLRSVSVPGRWIGEEGRLHPGPGIWALSLLAYAFWVGPRLSEPLNGSFRGYRLAAEWLETSGADGSPVVDATGWSQFYAARDGYTFANLHQALSDPKARYVVVRESHLHGPWWYCAVLKALVEGREPIATFPESRPDSPNRIAKVYLFDRQDVPNSTRSIKTVARR